MNDTCISHVIITGDTLQRLAAQYGVDSWESIAYLNDLKYPFIIDEIVLSNQKLNNIKYLGDTLLIPVTVATEIDYITDTELQKRTYGCDLYLDFNSNDSSILSFESQGQLKVNSSGDIEQTIGVENIKQAILLRLTTRYGELPMHSDYGSDFMDMIGLPKTQANLTKMKLEIIKIFKKDARVSDVQNCVVKSISGGVSIDCKIILVTPNESFDLSEAIAA